MITCHVEFSEFEIFLHLTVITLRFCIIIQNFAKTGQSAARLWPKTMFLNIRLHLEFLFVGPSVSRTKQSAAVDDLLSKQLEHRGPPCCSGLHHVGTSTPVLLSWISPSSELVASGGSHELEWCSRGIKLRRLNELQHSELTGGAEDGCWRLQPAESCSNPASGCLQLLEILEIYWNLKNLLEIFLNLYGPPGNFCATCRWPTALVSIHD